ncbi:immune inhibitor A domain-containing protein [Staphylospora marina]|uniref:immune inhibitor A domain-containing protein n=1 Tax=Staphylospora marina TaxID=2490858 RepID=UPI000F5BD99D|nr:immune inhibitor A domain-containing protein [Staphylospora marina]
MKFNRSLVALLSTSLLVGTAMLSPQAPRADAAPALDQGKHAHVDWAVVNQELLVKALEKQGKLRKNASPREIERAIREYVTRGQNPNTRTDGIDTSKTFGKKAWKGRKAVQERSAERIDAMKENTPERISGKTKHVDNAVVALIEFPDFPHNNIEREGDAHFWVEDFTPDHYRNLLFNKNGFKWEGQNLVTLTQFYLEQSGGYWEVAGKVTPWLKAKHNAAYYGAHYQTPDYELNDVRPRELVKETLEAVGQMIKGNEAKYDQRDPYDLDGDGNVMEPDGILDNLMIVHSGMGEEAGGGALGDDAIWSHRSVIGPEPVPIPGTSLKAFDYIIQPEDGATGVFAHEYGHNLGLPDEYDIGYTGTGSPIEYWSVMAGGSWAGKVPGTEPTGFSPWAKLFFRETFGGNWPTPTVIDFESLKNKKNVKLKEAVDPNSKGKLLKINLPARYVDPPTQPKGTKSYFSTKGDFLDTRMVSPEIDLTGKTTAKLVYDSWRQIEAGYDYLYVNVYVDGQATPVTVKEHSDVTNGWVKEEVDLSAFAGKKIRVEFRYVTDIALTMEGFYVDNIAVEADGATLFSDDAEGTPKFTLEGFKLFDGSPIPYDNYYLVEWRTHNGVDKGLAHIRRNDSLMVYDPGMLVWYYDARWGEDNMTGLHPGEGFLGVVDAHQRGHYWSDGNVGSTRYQVNDAAFGLKDTSPIDIVYPDFSMKYDPLPGVPSFDDRRDYSSPFNPAGGKLLPVHGLKLTVKHTYKKDREVMVEVSKVKR